MALIQSFENSGNILFKYRGQIPVLVFILAIPILFLTEGPVAMACAKADCSCTLRIVSMLLAFFITLAGLFLRAYTVSTTPKGTSGRNTQKQVADHLNTKGIYSIVRHPLYLANYLIWAGILVFAMNVWALLFVSLVYWIYYERIMFAEEAFLRKRFGNDFEEWSAQVPAFLPDFRLFERGNMRFSCKTFVRREYVTIFSTVFSYTLVDYLLAARPYCACTHSQAVGAFCWLRPSFWVLLICFVGMMVIRTIKHHTNLLKQDGARD